MMSPSVPNAVVATAIATGLFARNLLCAAAAALSVRPSGMTGVLFFQKPACADALAAPNRFRTRRQQLLRPTLHRGIMFRMAEHQWIHPPRLHSRSTLWRSVHRRLSLVVATELSWSRRPLARPQARMWILASSRIRRRLSLMWILAPSRIRRRLSMWILAPFRIRRRRSMRILALSRIRRRLSLRLRHYLQTRWRSVLTLHVTILMIDAKGDSVNSSLCTTPPP